jgi:hypothetical protein
MLIWDEITAIASVVSMVAFVLTALYVRGELKAIEKDRYVNITNQMFAIWQNEAFMEAQLWLLYRAPPGRLKLDSDTTTSAIQDL